MSVFANAIPVILRHEGGWVNDPDDLGGETNYGISTLIIKREGITAEELGISSFRPGALKGMTVDAAKAVYKKIYWDRYKYGEVTDDTVATKIFDAAVNCGPYWGHLLAQKAANACGQKLEEDGKFGPLTRAGINACNPEQWLKEMASAMAGHYQDITVKRPRNRKFLKNWLKRAAWIG